ncbi:MAG: histidine ammonia-lyase [Microbacterium sp.]|uniref:HAL/PAL/TAL family ammonia-lyase n=1 Tax=Microbacterium sp. TaxID=51671 RepID=UPI0039E238D4
MSLAPGSPSTVYLDGATLTVEDVVTVAYGAPGAPYVAMTDAARETTVTVRRYVEENWLSPDAGPIYGINTGLGRLMDVRVPVAELDRFQRLIINAHSAGIGEPMQEHEVRALLLLRVNALSKGHSGIRIECLDRLLAMLNLGVLPVIPWQGSVGASGDLAPLAHMVSVMIGHEKAEARYRGERMPARDALVAAGLEPDFALAPKDVLAMINGSTISLASAILSLADAELLARTADVAHALSLEAVRGEKAAYDSRIHAARNAEGQLESSENTRRLIAGSTLTTEDARRVKLPDENRPGDAYKPRVQDAYSFRCAPQVHGAAREGLRFARMLLTREANSATDNPLIFANDAGGYDVVSGGNFHGEPIGYAADLIAIAASELGAISERRSFRLTDPNLSYGLPLNLVGGQLGLNTGFSIVHCSASAIASENKLLSMPSVIDSIPGKANQEDHVSMCTYSARKARQVIANVQAILGVEFILAAQGIDLAAPHLAGFALGEGTKAAYDRVRETIPQTKEDVYQSEWMYAAQALVKSGTVPAAVATAIGALR